MARFYEPVKVGSSRDWRGCDDEDYWTSGDIYAARPCNHIGRTLGGDLKLGWEAADRLCDILEEVRAIAMAPDRAANGDLPVPQDCQARPEGIAQL